MAGFVEPVVVRLLLKALGRILSCHGAALELLFLLPRGILYSLCSDRILPRIKSLYNIIARMFEYNQFERSS